MVANKILHAQVDSVQLLRNLPSLQVHVIDQPTEVYQLLSLKHIEKVPREQDLFLVQLGGGFQATRHVHVRAQVTGIYLVAAPDRPFDRPADVESEAEANGVVGHSLVEFHVVLVFCDYRIGVDSDDDVDEGEEGHLCQLAVERVLLNLLEVENHLPVLEFGLVLGNVELPNDQKRVSDVLIRGASEFID